MRGITNLRLNALLVKLKETNNKLTEGCVNYIKSEYQVFHNSFSQAALQTQKDEGEMVARLTKLDRLRWIECLVHNDVRGVYRSMRNDI